MKLLTLWLVCLLTGAFTNARAQARQDTAANSTIDSAAYRPVLGHVHEQTAYDSEPLQIQLTAHNAAGNTLRFSMSNQPRGSKLNPRTGLFTWTPGIDQRKNHAIIFSVTDPLTRQADSKPAIIVVKEKPRPPVLSLHADTDLQQPLVRLVEGQNMVIVIEATDLNEQEEVTLDYFADGQPGKKLDNARFEVNGRSGTFLWSPTNAQAQKKVHQLYFTATDASGLSDEQVFKVLVKNVEHPPVFTSSITEYSVAEGKELNFRVKAEDADGDALRYGISSLDLPVNAYSFDPATGAFSWIPTLEQSMQLKSPVKLVFTASEQKPRPLQTSQTVYIKVTPVNYPPEVAPLEAKTVEEGRELVLKLDVNDKNGMANLKLQVLNPPDLSYDFNTDEAIFRWTPGFGFVPTGKEKEPLRIGFKVTDPAGSSDTEYVNITVTARENPELVYESYQEARALTDQMLQGVKMMKNGLRKPIRRKKTLNILFDGASIITGAATGLISQIGSEDFRQVALPAGASLTTLLGIRSIATRSLNEYEKLKEQLLNFEARLVSARNNLSFYQVDAGNEKLEDPFFKNDLQKYRKELERLDEEYRLLKAQYEKLAR